jgi:hypothetical protein
VNEEERIVTNERNSNKITCKYNLSNLVNSNYKDITTFAKSQSPGQKGPLNQTASSSKQVNEKVVFPQSKGLNMISLKNLNVVSKELDKNKCTSQSPKVKDLKISQGNQSPTSNNIIKILKNIPQSTKANESKFIYDPSKVKQKLYFRFQALEVTPAQPTSLLLRTIILPN